MGYCHVNTDDGRFYDDIGKNECFCLIDAVVNPATKEQCNLLFQKMHEAGYEWWDAKKKELRKIEQEENVELTDFESALFSAFSYAWQEYLSGKEVNVAKWAREHSAELLEVAREQKPACAWSEEDERSIRDSIFYLKSAKKYFEKDNDILWDEKWFNLCIEWLESLYKRPQQEWSEEDYGMLNELLNYCDHSIAYNGKGTLQANVWGKRKDWLKSLKERVQPQLKQEWSEEDDEHLERILKELENQYQKPINRPYLDKIESDYNWLKSLKPQNKWKPSDEQMKALSDMNLTGGVSSPKQGRELITLYNDLKKLK